MTAKGNGVLFGNTTKVPVGAMTVLARLENIVKDFGAVRALDGVTLEINQGEILGLMGTTEPASRHW